MMAFSIHDFLVQNIIKNPRRNEYQPAVAATFILGSLAYIYIAFGAYGKGLPIQQL
jgi:hypothetical protein